ncbi:hypothetical protein ciss_15240 [Carboxydothermus islandicus]|uniref:GGDEF domain-containing protein n=1 Tax=Carboxydothermus islandicus TaxID=661089 RepID=A0A1L8D3D8_9THEO|nr:diguanylate cyclase [Carboxydothermus islandicus]GAV25591.1 hypothetical protein ciss_15240 [Carboxydothermus islandicus]
MKKSEWTKQIITLLVLILLFSLLLWANAHRVHEKMMVQITNLQQKDAEKQIEMLEKAQGEKILLVLKTVASDPEFCELLQKKDREGIKKYLSEAFISWSSFGIDNLGILDPSKTVVLRLATPELYGENLKGFLNLKGVPGEYESKVVLGPLGYRFRVAVPVFTEGKLIGFLMGGMNWERILEEASKAYPDLGVVVFIENNRLKALGLDAKKPYGKVINLGEVSLIAQNRDYPLAHLKELAKLSQKFSGVRVISLENLQYSMLAKKGNYGETIIYLTPVDKNLQEYHRDIGIMVLLISFELLAVGLVLYGFYQRNYGITGKVTNYLKVINEKGLQTTEELKVKEIGECSLELGRFIENTRKLVKSLEDEVELNRLLKNEKEEDAMYQLLINFLHQKYDINNAAILVLNESQNYLEVKALVGEIFCNAKILEDKDACLAISRGRIVFHFPGSLENCPQYTTPNNYACIPMIIGGEVKGLIHVTCKENNPEKLKKVERAVEIAAPYLYNARLLKVLEYTSMVDELTKVYNRRFLVNFLEKEIAFSRRHGKELGLILLDLDDFKLINDVYGHAAGDEVLRKVGEVLKQKVRAQDVVARYGGEEFCVVLPGTGWQGSYEVASKLKDALAELKFSEPGLKVTASIGVTVFPIEAKNLEELLGVADKLLYYAKNAGKNRVITLKDLDLPNS